MATGVDVQTERLPGIKVVVRGLDLCKRLLRKVDMELRFGLQHPILTHQRAGCAKSVDICEVDEFA